MNPIATGAAVGYLGVSPTGHFTGMPTAEWRLEKAGNVIRSTCFMIRHTKSIASEGLVAGTDLRDSFHEILWDATKLYCDAVRELYGKEQYALATWSPDLPKFLFERPERCEDSLKIVASDDYRDNYYDKGSSG